MAASVSELRARASVLYGQLQGPSGLLHSAWKKIAPVYPETKQGLVFSVVNREERVISPTHSERREAAQRRRKAMATFYRWSYDAICLYKTAMESPAANSLAILDAVGKLETLQAEVGATPVENMYNAEKSDWLIRVAVESGLAHNHVKKLVSFAANLLPYDYDLYAVKSTDSSTQYQIYLASSNDPSAHAVGEFSKQPHSFASKKVFDAAMAKGNVPSQVVSLGYNETASASKNSGTYLLTGVDYFVEIQSSLFRNASDGLLKHVENILYSCGVDFEQFWADNSMQISSGAGHVPSSAVFSIFSNKGEWLHPVVDMKLFFASYWGEKTAQLQVVPNGSMRIKLHDGRIFEVANYSLANR